MIFSLMRRVLPHRQLFTVRLQHIIPATPALRKRKDELLEDSADWIHRQTNYPKWWVADVLRRWANEPEVHSVSWWAHHLGKPQSTLWRWAWGKNNQSVYTIIQRELDQAIDALAEPMRERKLVFDSSSEKVVDTK